MSNIVDSKLYMFPKSLSCGCLKTYRIHGHSDRGITHSMFYPYFSWKFVYNKFGELTAPNDGLLQVSFYLTLTSSQPQIKEKTSNEKLIIVHS